jgi:hypothetical protein
MSVVFDVASALNIFWSLAGDEAKGDLRQRLNDLTERRQIVRSATAALSGSVKFRGREVGVLLSSPTFIEFVLDPDSQPLSDADALLLSQLAGGTSAAQAATVLATALVSVVFGSATLVERMLLKQAEQTDETTLWTLIVALDLQSQLIAVASEQGRLVDAVIADLELLVDGPPKPIADLDLSAWWPFNSELTGGQIPTYISRDFDGEVASELVRRAGGHDAALLVLGGPAKSGKSRSLVEALRAALPTHLLLRLRTSRRDAIDDMTARLRAGPAIPPFVVFIDDLVGQLALGLTAGLFSRLG